eukprot:gb/GECG01016476.1/.p1 GENE.gb/GECG01016476.1/~~gb/GECG01016476.1/.p1  ORF type:complete len:624 (+),score=86.75 gb/GECG01016476.1/:1-1872(+)
MSETTEEPSAQSSAYVQSLDQLREQYDALIKEWDQLAQSVFHSSFSSPQSGAVATSAGDSGKHQKDHLLHEEHGLSSAESDESVEYSWTSHQRQEQEEHVQQQSPEGATSAPAVVRKDEDRTLHPDDGQLLATIVSNHPAVALAISKLSDLRFYCLPSDGKSSPYAILHDVIDRLSYILTEYCSVRAFRDDTEESSRRFRAGSWDFSSPSNAQLRATIRPIIERHLFSRLVPDLHANYQKVQKPLIDSEKVVSLVNLDSIPGEYIGMNSVDALSEAGGSDDGEAPPSKQGTVDLPVLRRVIQQQATAEILMMMHAVCPFDKLKSFQRSIKILSKLQQLGWSIEDSTIHAVFDGKYGTSSSTPGEANEMVAHEDKGHVDGEQRKLKYKAQEWSKLPPTASQIGRGTEEAFSDDYGDDAFEETQDKPGVTLSQLSRSENGTGEAKSNAATCICKSWLALLASLFRKKQSDSSYDLVEVKKRLRAELVFLRTFGDWREGDILYSHENGIDLSSAIDMALKRSHEMKVLLFSASSVMDYIAQLLPEPVHHGSEAQDVGYGVSEDAVSQNAGFHTSLATMSLARSVLEGLRKATTYKTQNGLDPKETVSWMFECFNLLLYTLPLYFTG